MAELEFVDWDGLVYYDNKIKEYIERRDETYVKMGGAVYFAMLPAPSSENVNCVYRVLDDFTSNRYFLRPNTSYAAGTFVQVTDFNNNLFLYTIFNEELKDVVTQAELEDAVKQEVEETIADDIEKTVNERIQELHDNGELVVSVKSIAYGTF